MDERSTKLEQENDRLREALDLAKTEIDQLRGLKSGSEVLKSVSVDHGSPPGKANSKQGPTIVLKLDLSGIASLRALEPILSSGAEALRIEPYCEA